MARQTAGMWETEVHLAQGGLWMEDLASCSWRALIGIISGEVLISDGGQPATTEDPVCAQSP